METSFTPPPIPADQFRELQRAIAHAAVDRLIEESNRGEAATRSDLADAGERKSA